MDLPTHLLQHLRDFRSDIRFHEVMMAIWREWIDEKRAQV
jgi:hypothetical protein